MALLALALALGSSSLVLLGMMAGLWSCSLAWAIGLVLMWCSKDLLLFFFLAQTAVMPAVA